MLRFVCVVVAVVLIQLSYCDVGGDYDPPKMIHLALTGNPSEMVVSWTTAFSAASHVEVNQKGKIERSHFEGTEITYLKSAGYIHHTKITGLSPSTEYVYRCGSTLTGMSSDFTFTTAPPVGSQDDRAFIIYGDMGIFEYSYHTVQHVSTLVGESDLNIDLIYQSGDYGYGNDRDAMYYETSWNMFFDQMTLPMRKVPYMTAPGNHEADCGHAECNFYASNFTVYNSRFRMPSEESGAPAGQNMWFSFNYGNVHWVTISTETDFPNAPYHYTYGDQLSWLEKDLSTASVDPNVDWIIVTGHQPIYCSVSGKSDEYGIPTGDTRNVQQAFEELLYQYKVDLYVDGHVHGYERSYPVYQSEVRGNYTLNNYVNPEAPIYIVNGSAGNIEGFYDDWNENPPSWSAKRYWPNPEHGYGVIQTYGANQLRWTWYRNAGEPLDNDYFDYFLINRE